MKKNFYLPKFVLVILIGIVGLPTWVFWQFPGFHERFFTAIMSNVDSVGYTGNEFFGSDSMQIFYLSWKMKEALIGTGYPVFSDMFNFASKNEVFYDFHIGIQYLINALSSIIFGSDVAGYNFGVMILPLMVTFYCGYFLLSAISKSYFFSILGAFSLTIIPYRIIALAGGHGINIVFFLAPLYWGSVIRHAINLAQDSVRFRFDAIAGIALLLSLISEEHLGYYLVLSSAFIFPIWFLQSYFGQFQKLNRQSSKAAHFTLALISYVTKWRYLVASLIPVYLYSLVLSKFVMSSKPYRDEAEVAHYSVPLTEFLGHSSMYNFAAVMLPSIILVFLVHQLVLKKKFKVKEVFLSFWFPIALTFILMFILTGGMGEHWSQQNQIFRLFRSVFPYFSYQRIPAKFYVVSATLMFMLGAVLVSVLMDHAAKTERRSHKQISLVLLGILGLGLCGQVWEQIWVLRQRYFAGYYSPMNVGSEKVFSKVREVVPVGDVVLSVPVSPQMDRYATYAQYVAFRTHRRFAQGYHGLPPAWFGDALPFLLEFNSGIPSVAAFQKLEQLGVRWILVDGRALRTLKLADLSKSFSSISNLSLISCEYSDCLYRVSY